mmetsp:Transcript_1595/g.3057  ORF Transcript_1595/g.3057 Transcript_1595/m.3057 type:complete len:151 (+) Transcript_1595:170-622(+)
MKRLLKAVGALHVAALSSSSSLLPSGLALAMTTAAASSASSPAAAAAAGAGAAAAADGTCNGAICRKYTARNFQAALDSINAMGAIAERENHHPDFHLTGYRNVEVVLFTHSLGGISMNDIELAKMLDADVIVDYSPKWLKSHPEAKRED